jgi:hypothetical protein
LFDAADYDHWPTWPLVAKVAKVRDYRDYLASAGWQVTRQWALAAAGWRCQLCPRRTRLEVHHRIYRGWGQEQDGDLIVLCHVCHRRHHGRGGRRPGDNRP